MLKYIEQKSGHADDGPAWIGRVNMSRSGRTLYFNGKALKRSYGQGNAGNHYDLETGDEYWVPGIKKRGANRHWAGSGLVMIEAGAVTEFLQVVGLETLDACRFRVVADFPETKPSVFYYLENRSLNR